MRYCFTITLKIEFVVLTAFQWKKALINLFMPAYIGDFLISVRKLQGICKNKSIFQERVTFKNMHVISILEAMSIQRLIHGLTTRTFIQVLRLERNICAWTTFPLQVLSNRPSFWYLLLFKTNTPVRIPGSEKARIMVLC